LVRDSPLMQWRAEVWFLVGVTFLVGAFVVLFSVWHPSDGSYSGYSFEIVDGWMFISDAGQSHGGFEYTGQYEVDIAPAHEEFIFDGSVVDMRLTLELGLGDPIEPHNLTMVIDYYPKTDQVLLDFDGSQIVLDMVEIDDVWNHEYDGWYAASWGSEAPPNEVHGEISPEMFGLPAHYYVDMRLHIYVGHIVA